MSNESKCRGARWGGAVSGEDQLPMARQVEVVLITPFLPAPSPTPAAGRVGEQHLLHRFIKRTFLEEIEVGLMWVMNSGVP